MLTLCAGLAIGCTPRAPRAAPYLRHRRSARRARALRVRAIRSATRRAWWRWCARPARSSSAATAITNRRAARAGRAQGAAHRAHLGLLGRVDEPPAPIVLAGGREAARALARRGPWIVVNQGRRRARPIPSASGRVGRRAGGSAAACRRDRAGAARRDDRRRGQPSASWRRSSNRCSPVARDAVRRGQARRGGEAARGSRRGGDHRGRRAFTWRLVSLDRSRCDAQVAPVRRLDDIARITRAPARAEGQPVPLPAGVAGCAGATRARCHGAAHASGARRRGHAFATWFHRQGVERAACRATSPALASPAARRSPRRALRDVGCENCHGPASLHVADDGLDDPPTLRRAVPGRVPRLS